ncbi:MAG: hypothetical protein ACI4JF_01495 [Oscillospiraceae bacterium]
METDFVKICAPDGIMYGGDQSMFGKNARRSGCGMIAACDMLLYLDGQRDISLEKYTDFVSDMRDRIFYRRRLNIIGIFPRRLIKILRRISGRDFVYRPKRSFTEETLADYIGKAVAVGRPLIVRVGYNGKALPYTIEYRGGKRCCGKMCWHYITVTGIDGGTLTFSSWGGKGEMLCCDLYRYFGLSGGIISEV